MIILRVWLLKDGVTEENKGRIVDIERLNYDRKTTSKKFKQITNRCYIQSTLISGSDTINNGPRVIRESFKTCLLPTSTVLVRPFSKLNNEFYSWILSLYKSTTFFKFYIFLLITI